jgi:hypothetical protein
MLKVVILVLLFLGVLMMVIDIVRIKAGLVEQKPRIIYRYIPSTFEESQMDPIYVSEIFDTMFSTFSPWVGSVRNYDTRKQEKVNQYFVNQM